MLKRPVIVSEWILVCRYHFHSQLWNYIANPLQESCIVKHSKLRTARINSAHPVHALWHCLITWSHMNFLEKLSSFFCKDGWFYLEKQQLIFGFLSIIYGPRSSFSHAIQTLLPRKTNFLDFSFLVHSFLQCLSASYM